MALLDGSDLLNSITDRVLDTLKAFAAADEDWEDPIFVRGHPAINVDEELLRPIVSVVVYNSEAEDVGYDNLLGTNDLLPSDPNYEEFHGVGMFVDLVIQIWVSKPTATRPQQTGGGTLAARISSKIQTRLRGHTECLGEEIDVIRIRDEGLFVPGNSAEPLMMYRQLDLQLETTAVLENV